MTEKNTRTFIGAFVLGAVALLAVFVVLLGSGVLSGVKPTFVLYFNTSLKGLTQGSPVYFKGIRVGSVKSIQIRPDLETMQFATPVVIEIEKDKAIALSDGRDTDVFNNAEAIYRLIEKGLRARLSLTSILTGQLCVELDILANAAPVDLAALKPYRGSPQIPTQLSSLNAALDTLEGIPIQEVLYDMVGSIRSVSKQLQAMDVNRLMESIRSLSDEARLRLGELAGLKESTDAVLSAYAGLALSAKDDLHSTLTRAERTLARIDALTDVSAGTMTAMRESAGNASSLFRADSAVVVEFSQTMQALRKAAQALDNLAVLLELKPDALIFGRDKP